MFASIREDIAAVKDRDPAAKSSLEIVSIINAEDAKIATSAGGLYKLVLNKYWIDELYSAAIIGPLLAFSRTVLWHDVDQKVIDGTVNESAAAARDVSQIVRLQQSGLIRSYAGWVAMGAAAVVAYMVWMGTR